MGFLIYISILLFLVINHSEESNTFFDSYLLNKYENTKTILTSNFHEHYRKQRDVETTVSLHNVQEFYLNSISFSFEMDNATYILIEYQIYTLQLIENQFILEPHSFLPKAESEILLIKSIDYEDGTLLLLVFTSGFSNVYIRRKSDWIFMQRVHNIGIVSDAQLFHHYNTLYLFLLNYMGSASVPSTLYKWTGMHFDEMHNVLTTGATSITCFEYMNSVIITITQNPSDYTKAGTIVMRFKNSKLRKLQFLNTEAAEEVLTYVLNGERYIIILCTLSNIGTVYKWNGNYFMSWIYFEIQMGFKKVSVNYYVDNRPVLYSINKDSATLYDIQHNYIEIISRVSLENRYEQILDINTFALNQNKYIYVCGVTEDYYANMIFVSYSLHTNKIEDQIYSESVVQCYSDLNERLRFRVKLLTNLIYKSDRMLQVDKVIQFNNTLKMKIVTLKNSTVVTEYSTKFYEQNAKPIQQHLKTLKNKMANIKQHINVLINDVIIEGNMYVKYVEASAIHTATLNENTWNPNSWLLLSNDQTIQSEVLAAYVRSKHVKVSHENSLLKQLLLVEGNEIINNFIIINSLKSNNLRITNINNIVTENLYRRSTLTTIKGKKYINRISTVKMLSTVMNNIEVHEILQLIKAPVVLQNYFIEEINLTYLNFEEIYGISWNKYTDNFVKKNHVNTIAGDLLINSNLNVNNLVTGTITGIDVETLFTISTNQTISSDMQLMNINVNHIISNNINGLSFRKYAVILQENNHISGPVSIQNVLVQKDIVGYNISKSNFYNDKNQFVQIYDNYLKITGNLHITNILTTDAPKIFYQSKLTDFNFANDYWLKNVEQAITFNVIFNELFILHLTIQYLNHKSLVDYLMNNYKNNLYQLNFKNIFVPGNIILNLNYSQTTFYTEQLKENCVRRSGSFKISGYKIFSNLLEIDNLQAHILDNTIFKQVIQKENSYKFADKTFSNLIFEENLNLPKKYKLKTKKINGFTITNLMKRTAFINEASFSTNWNLRQITANNVVFQSTNKGDIDTLTQNIVPLFGSEFLKTLSIDDISLGKVYKTVQCNDINLVEYLSNIAWTNDVLFINDTINFTGNLYIENFNPIIVNSVYLKNLTEQYLFRNKIQTIHATFDFDTVQSPFLITTAVNNINIENLIRFRDEDIHIYTDLFLMTLISNSVTTKYFNNNINQFKDISKVSLNRFWRNVTILNDIYLLNQNGNINYIMNNVLHTQHSRHVITENVHFNLISATNANIVDSKINGINIQEMVSDALLRRHTNQLVVGFNTFRKIYAAGASVYKNANIKEINDINIGELNASLVNKHLQNTILGSKQFNAGIQIKNLQAASTVHNFDPKYLVTTGNTKENLPNVHIEQMKIMNDLDAVIINDIHIIKILQGIVLRNADSTQYIYGKINFKDVSFIDTAEILSLNNININNVVVDDGVQTITGLKQFVSSLDILSNMKVSFLNGYNITQEFEKSLLLQNDARLKTSVTFKNSPNMYNNINTAKINNINITQAIEPLNRNVYKTKINSTIEYIIKLDSILVRYSKKLSGGQEFLNIMLAKHIQIPRHDSIGSYQYQINNNTIFNVLHEKQNDNCTQRSFSVYDHTSLPSYLTSEIDNHRIFSFNENNWIINVVTESTSKNSTCRHEREQVYIIWVSPDSIRPLVVNISESSHISEVYSFVLHNKAFVIITKLYETYSVTQVKRLATDKNEFNIVQNITVELGSKTRLFQIAQNYILVIGKRHEFKYNNEDTKIYIFNQYNEKFLLLQTIPSSGTISSTSLSLDEEQYYVMLAEQNFKIQVLNYNVHESNYFISQNMYSDSTILEVNTIEMKGINSNEVSLTVLTDYNQFFIYSFKYIEGWKCVAYGYIDGLQSLTTFLLNGQKYVFAHSKSKSDILFISIQGIN